MAPDRLVGWAAFLPEKTSPCTLEIACKNAVVAACRICGPMLTPVTNVMYALTCASLIIKVKYRPYIYFKRPSNTQCCFDNKMDAWVLNIGLYFITRYSKSESKTISHHFQEGILIVHSRVVRLIWHRHVTSQHARLVRPWDRFYSRISFSISLLF